VQTTTLWSRGGVGQEPLLEFRVRPRFRHDARPDMGPDPGFVGVDDDIERLRVDVALFGQDRLKRADPQLHLAELRTVIMLVVIVVVVVWMQVHWHVIASLHRRP
jgi:hypothetical protein